MTCVASPICVGGILSDNPTGTLSIGGFDLTTDAWTTLDLTGLWMWRNRGENVLVPGTNGKRPYLVRPDETDHDIPMVIIGSVNKDGEVYDDGPWYGLYANVRTIQANLLTPHVYRSAILTLPDGSSTLSANVQVLDFQLGDHDNNARYVATLSIRVPGGAFL